MCTCFFAFSTNFNTFYLLQITETCTKVMFVKSDIADISNVTSSTKSVTVESLGVKKGSGWTPAETDQPQSLTLEFADSVEVRGIMVDAVKLGTFTLSYGPDQTSSKVYKENGKTKVCY